MKNRSDVVIIGAGIIGLTCAYYLNRLGRSVRIIEKDTVFSGASYGNCGLIFSSHLAPLCSPGIMFNEINRIVRSNAPIILSPKAGAGLLKWLPGFIRNGDLTKFVKTIGYRQSLLSSSRELYRQFFADSPPDCDVDQKGILMVFDNQDSMESYGAGLWYRDQYRIKVRPVIGDELYRLEPNLPSGLYGGWYYEEDSHLRPDKLGLNWSKRLIREGVDIRERCLVMGFEIDGGTLKSVVTNRGKYSADHIILANGSWAARFAKPLGIRIPIQPAKGYSVTMNNVSSSIGRPVYYHDKRVVLTPWESGLRIGGILELSGLDHFINPRRINDLRIDSARIIKDLLWDSNREEWCGLRPLCVDDLPIIGRSPRHDNLWLACGHGTTGFSMAPATGQLIADMITERTPFIDPTPYSADRF